MIKNATSFNLAFVWCATILGAACERAEPSAPANAANSELGGTSATVALDEEPKELLVPPYVPQGELPKPQRPDSKQADLDPENDTVVAPPEPIADCDAKLLTAGVNFKPAELPLKQKRGNTFTCGAEQVVIYLGGPGQIRYNAAPVMTCRMALALAEFEKIAQEESVKTLGQRIARFTHIGTYSCRKMARFDYVSEHSYANAIDIQTITLEDGKRVAVEKHFGALNAPPSTAEATFLRKLANRAFDEEVFSVVLTPYWDKLHADHLHVDLARYRVDGSRP